MKKKLISTLLTAGLVLSLAACGNAGASQTTQAAPAQTTAAPAQTTAATEPTTAAPAETTAAATPAAAEPVLIRTGSLKGPTTMGLLPMMEKAEQGGLPFNAEFTMAVTADEINAKLVSGDLDIALIPANVASVLYNKTKGGVRVIDINTLGVLYGVTGDESVKSLADLRGKKVFMPGQGATPEFVFNYLLAQNGMTDEVEIDFRNEATEIAALLKEDPKGIAILPQPFATVCTVQNPEVKEFMSLTEEWDACSGDGSQMLTGVTIVRKAFAEEHPDAVKQFIEAHAESAKQAMDDQAAEAELIVKYGIIEKAPIAQKALPKCSIVCIGGDEMKLALEGYLKVLFEANPASVGGALPGEDFWF